MHRPPNARGSRGAANLPPARTLLALAGVARLAEIAADTGAVLAPWPAPKSTATRTTPVFQQSPRLGQIVPLVHCSCSDAIKSDAKASGDHHGSPNTCRSARGRIGVGSPRRSCRPHHQGRRGAIRHRPRIDRGCLLRRYQPGRRGQPQRRAHGRAAGGPPRVRAGFDGESPLCVGAGSRQHRGAHDRGESRRCVHRGRRRVDEPCTFSMLLSRKKRNPRSTGRSRSSTACRSGWRLVNPRTGGAASPTVCHGQGGDRRECRPQSTRSAGRIRISSRCSASNGGRRRTNEKSSPRRSCPSRFRSARALRPPASAWTSTRGPDGTTLENLAQAETRILQRRPRHGYPRAR